MKKSDSIEILKKNWENTFYKEFEEVELNEKIIDHTQDISDLEADIWYFDDLIDEEDDNIIFSKPD